MGKHYYSYYPKRNVKFSYKGCSYCNNPQKSLHLSECF